MSAIPSSPPDNPNGFAERYGIAADALAPANAVIEGLLGHRSVRAYSDRPVPEGTVEQLVAAAQSASSSSNLQLWSVMQVSDPARRQRLSEVGAGQKYIASAPLFLVWLADLSRAERVGQAQGVTMDGLDFTESFLMGVVDAALAAQNAAVAAESMGLGVVYIGGMRNDPVRVAQELGLPPKVMAVFGMCVGWADPARPASVKPRLPQSAVLHREQYGAPAEADHIASYDAALHRFQDGQGMTRQGWTPQQVSRLRSGASLGTRHALRDAIHQLGFELK
jgi:nitroreductase